MGFIPSANTVYAVAYLTEIGRAYLFNENNNRFDSTGDDLFEIKKFSLSDVDTNYMLDQSDSSPYKLQSGDVPDVTGKSEGCLKTASNYIQTSLLAYVFDSTPNNVQYSTNLSSSNPPVLLINESGIPSSNETFTFVSSSAPGNVSLNPGSLSQ